MAKQMKGITICGDCGFYNWKKHRCSRGCTAEGTAQSHFYEDCPLPDVREVVRGEWKYHDSFSWLCSKCGWQNYHNAGVPNPYNFCPNCGADMREES